MIVNNTSPSRKDEFSPFKLFLRKARTRTGTTGIIDIDVDYLKNLWEQQQGICPYTNLKLELFTNSLRQASLDRIESSKGYIKGNVEFVSLFINYAKNNFSKDEVLSFISDIKNENTGDQNNRRISE